MGAKSSQVKLRRLRLFQPCFSLFQRQAESSLKERAPAGQEEAVDTSCVMEELYGSGSRLLSRGCESRPEIVIQDHWG
jgi:hypothetical protein